MTSCLARILLGISTAVALGAGASHASTSAELIRLGDSLMQQSRDVLDSSRYAPAREAYERALALEPNETRAMIGLAWVFNSLHDFDQGERWCRAALAVDENLPDAHALLGDRAVELGQYEAALDHYQLALDLRPDLASYSRAAHLLWLTGEPERARELMSAAIAAGGVHAENTAWCAAQLALMLWHAGELEAAGAIAVAALERAPENVHLLHALSREQAARGELAAAIDLCRRSIGIAATHDALADLVDLLLADGQRDEARRQIARVLAFHANHHEHAETPPDASDPAKPHYHGNIQLAAFLADHGLGLTDALGEAEAGAAATPNVAAFDVLAWCYYRLGRDHDAATQIERALRWNTPSALLHFHAGMIHARIGDQAKAREHLERALSLNPQFHPRYAARAKETLEALVAPSEPPTTRPRAS
jgi:tetratricopeptide (TPR) repeat protein